MNTYCTGHLKEEEKMPRKHMIISGHVQGVGFRYHANHIARALHLTGWVRNLDSGDVEMEIQGSRETIEKFFTQLEKGSMFIQIENIRSQECEEIPEREFVIR